MPTDTIVKHTPGPWDAHIEHNTSISYNDLRYDGDVWIVGAEHWTGLAVVATEGARNTPESEANARLIAAAPTMLAELKTIHAGMACSCRLQTFVGGPVPCRTCQIGAVIVAAEGAK